MKVPVSRCFPFLSVALFQCVLFGNDRDIILPEESCRRVCGAEEAYVAPFLVYLFDFNKQKNRHALRLPGEAVWHAMGDECRIALYLCYFYVLLAIEPCVWQMDRFASIVGGVSDQK